MRGSIDLFPCEGQICLLRRNILPLQAMSLQSDNKMAAPLHTLVLTVSRMRGALTPVSIRLHYLMLLHKQIYLFICFLFSCRSRS
jgi:hypothetical protein